MSQKNKIKNVDKNKSI